MTASPLPFVLRTNWFSLPRSKYTSAPLKAWPSAFLTFTLRVPSIFLSFTVISFSVSDEFPSLSTTVSLTLYVPASLYLWTAFAPAAFSVLSPKSISYEMIPVSSDEREASNRYSTFCSIMLSQFSTAFGLLLSGSITCSSAVRNEVFPIASTASTLYSRTVRFNGRFQSSQE